MDCRGAFDQLIRCLSASGQMRNYYRYGEFQSCNDCYEKFAFCLFNSKDDAKIEQFNNERLDKTKKFVGSSDDIWQERV